MMEYAPYNFARELQYKAYYELLADERLVRMYEVEARQGRGAKTYTPEQMMDDITRAVFIRPGNRTLTIWERMSQKNYLDALIVSSISRWSKPPNWVQRSTNTTDADAVR